MLSCCFFAGRNRQNNANRISPNAPTTSSPSSRPTPYLVAPNIPTIPIGNLVESLNLPPPPPPSPASPHRPALLMAQSTAQSDVAPGGEEPHPLGMNF